MKEPWTTDQHPSYLGDGVYAWDDGYQIWIGTERNSHWDIIALDNDTFSALFNYKKSRENI